jgi:hypothetical protein
MLLEQFSWLQVATWIVLSVSLCNVRLIFFYYKLFWPLILVVWFPCSNIQGPNFFRIRLTKCHNYKGLKCVEYSVTQLLIRWFIEIYFQSYIISSSDMFRLVQLQPSSGWSFVFKYHHMSLMDFVVSPPGYGRSVTDFWDRDAHEAQLRCPDEVDGDIWIWSARRGLKPKFY